MAWGRAIHGMFEYIHKYKLNNSLVGPIKTVNADRKYITGAEKSGIISAIITVRMMLVRKKVEAL